MFRRYKIVNPVRFISFLIIFSLLIVGIFNFFIDNFKVYALEKQEYFKVTVISGDSLWSIASNYVQKNQDIRELVYLIGEINNIENGMIYEGQKLKIPKNK